MAFETVLGSPDPAAALRAEAIEQGVPSALRAGPGVVGPNAVLQLISAMRDRLGSAAAAGFFQRAEALDLYLDPPREMIDERAPQRLFRALYDAYAPEMAEALLRDAGRRTGSYVARNRVPRPARWVLRRLPIAFGERVLLRAIEAKAWTFAGSGACRTTPRSWFSDAPAVIEIVDNPLETPGCPWHAAVFERLYEKLLRRSVYAASSSESGRVSRFELTFAR